MALPLWDAGGLKGDSEGFPLHLDQIVVQVPIDDLTNGILNSIARQRVKVVDFDFRVEATLKEGSLSPSRYSLAKLDQGSTSTELLPPNDKSGWCTSHFNSLCGRVHKEARPQSIP